MSKIRKQYQEDMSTEQISQDVYENTLYAMKNKIQPAATPIKRFKWSVLLPIAAMFVITVTAVTAVLVPQFLKPSEWSGYEGHVYTQDENDRIINNVEEKLWQTIGININESVSDNNLTIIVKDIVCDESLMYINFDVTTNNGTPLQENSEYKKSVLVRQGFSEAYIECEGEKYKLYMFRIDNAISPNMASFEGTINLTDITSSGEIVKADLLGKNIKLVLSDFTDDVEISADIGFQYDSLADLYKKIIPAETDDFINIGTYITYANGTKAYHYTLPKGTQQIPFSDKYPGAYIDNIGFHQVGESNTKALYISINPGSEENTAAMQNLAFKNIITGDIIYSYYDFYSAGYSSDEDIDLSLNDGRIIITLQQGLDKYYGTERRDLTEADLSNYIIIGNASQERYVREQGVWEFGFIVDKIAEPKTYTINQNISVGDGTVNIDTLTLSPLHLYINGTAIESNVSTIPMNAYFIMKDGTTQEVSRKGASGRIDTVLELEFILDKFLDIDNVESLCIWNTVIPLK